MDRDETTRICMRDVATAESGRDFSDIEYSGRMETDPPDWDYLKIVSQRVRGVNSLLDLGTGMGETLLAIPELPIHTTATESQELKVDIARLRLSQKGVRIFHMESGGELPFRDSSFQLVLCYEQPYDPDEIFRILRPGGIFLTQQMRGDNCLELNQLLKIQRPGSFARRHLTNARKALEALNMIVIDARESSGYSRFYDAGAAAFYAKLKPQELPGFSVYRCEDGLWDIQRRTEAHGYIACRAPRFLLIAKKEE